MAEPLSHPEQSASRHRPSVGDARMALSASWQCPVCDRDGAHHDPRCLIGKLAILVLESRGVSITDPFAPGGCYS